MTLKLYGLSEATLLLFLDTILRAARLGILFGSEAVSVLP